MRAATLDGFQERAGMGMAVLLTVRDVAERLGYSRSTILAWTRRGILPGFRMPDGALRYREEELEVWIAERATDGSSELGCQTLAATLESAE